MNLTLKDRVIILNTVLPRFDTRSNIEIVKAIKDNISLSDIENSMIVATNLGNNQYDISFKTVEAITQEDSYSFTNEEIEYLKNRVEFIDSNGMFSSETIGTYDKIMDASNEQLK